LPTARTVRPFKLSYFGYFEKPYSDRVVEMRNMDQPINSLDEFDLSQAKVEFGGILEERGDRPSSMVTLPSGFPEAKLYALLKALFGRPQGMMSLALHPKGDPDAIFKYEFSIELPDKTRLAIMRSWLNVEVHSFGRKVSRQELLRLFTSNFSLHEDRLKATLDDLEVYRLVINPHFRHKKMMKFFEEELKKINAQPPQFPKTLMVTRPEEKHYAKSLHAYISEVERQNCYAMSLVMESAYTAESYLNLALALLHNEVLRTNPKMLSDALYETWRDKVERLPLHCDRVAKQPSLNDKPVKNLERVFKLRNKIAHSYPDQEDLCAAKIWFDQSIPLLPACESHVIYQWGVNSLLPSREEALGCPSIVNGFISYIEGILDRDAKEMIQRAARTNPLGFSEVTKRYGIPYGEDIVVGLFVAK
jgi:hypothetical protein